MIKISEIFYTLTETAAKLGVERHTVWRRINAGAIPAQKAGGVVFIEKQIVHDLQETDAAKPPFGPTGGSQ